MPKEVAKALAMLDSSLVGRRWMLFVDGENLTARASDIFEAEGVRELLKPGRYYKPGGFIWIPRVAPRRSFLDIEGGYPLMAHGHRAHYFAMTQGNGVDVDQLRKTIRTCGFEPHVFHKPKGQHAKRIDIDLAVRMVTAAALDQYDIAVLMTGDEDYVPAVESIKNDFGKTVYLSFFDHEKGGLSSELRLACDNFFDLTYEFMNHWAYYEAGLQDHDPFRLST